MNKKKRSPIHAYKRLLARDHDWDWCFLLALEKKKLQRMRDQFEKEKLHKGWEQTVRELGICVRLIDIITGDDAQYKTWLDKNFSHPIKFIKHEDGLSELDFSEHPPLEEMPVYVNTRNELRFFRKELIQEAMDGGNREHAMHLKPELRKLKALHLYNMIREYKMFQWWD